MWQKVKDTIKVLLPNTLLNKVRPIGHGLVALIAQAYFGNPSKKLTVIGVTGTAGKSTTVNILAHILNTAGHKTGFSTTTNYSLGNTVHINKHGLSMPGGWVLAQQLSAMVKNGCTHAIIECTSEGLAQNRHRGITFTGALFTNLSPAHIDSHGSFAKYRQAKGKLFGALKKSANNFIGVNLDDKATEYFFNFPAEKKIGVTTKDLKLPHSVVYAAINIHNSPTISFTVSNVKFSAPLVGTFNVYNALLAVACAHTLGISLEAGAKALTSMPVVPGRMESIPNSRGFTVFVDYAPEPSAMQNSLETVDQLPHKKIIHVFGTTGGHRDKAKRFEFGKISAKLSDTIIITNDDVYDSNPNEIAQNTISAIDEVPQNEKKVSDVVVMLDRRSAIAQALRLAQSGDIILITGKGSEQFLVLPGNRRIPWDEREVVKEELKKL